MPTPIRTALALALVLCLATAPATAQTHFVATPTGDEIAAAAGEVLIVDIRRPEEWRATGVLPDALLITWEDGPGFLAQLAPHLRPGVPVALICRTGNRTAQAAARLAPHLDAPVIDLAGGMVRLMAEGYTPSAPTAAQGCTTC